MGIAPLHRSRKNDRCEYILLTVYVMHKITSSGYSSSLKEMAARNPPRVLNPTALAFPM
jgi:hypothetical protein